MIRPLRHHVRELVDPFDMRNCLPTNILWFALALFPHLDGSHVECLKTLNANRESCYAVMMEADGVSRSEAKRRFLMAFSLNYHGSLDDGSGGGQSIFSRDSFFKTLQRELAEVQAHLFHHAVLQPLAALCSSHQNPYGSMVMSLHTMAEAKQWTIAKSCLESPEVQADLKAANGLEPDAPAVRVVANTFDEIGIEKAVQENGELVSYVGEAEIRGRVCDKLTASVAAAFPGMRMLFEVKGGDALIRNPRGVVVGTMPSPTAGMVLDEFWLVNEGYAHQALRNVMRFFGSVLIKVGYRWVLLSHEAGVPNEACCRGG